MMLQSNMPYGLVSRYNMHNQTSLMMLEAALRAEDKTLSNKISTAVRKELNEELAYYNAIGEKRAQRMQYEVQRTQNLLQMMEQMEGMYKQRSLERSGIIKSSDSTPVDNTKTDSSNK
jgi:hypothetical protein